MEDVVYFELNNWSAGDHYPDDEPFCTWLLDDISQYFLNDKWVKENQLCVVADIIDMAVNICVSATKQWVQENCPLLLTDYSEFIRQPDDSGVVQGRFGHKFTTYSPNEIGILWRYLYN